MKKRIETAFLIICMVFAVTGIVLTIMIYYDSLKSIGNTALFSKLMLKIYFEIVVFLLCLMALLIIAFRKNGSFSSGIGKKDSLTGIGNKHYLESMYNKYNVEYGNHLCLAYFAFSSEVILQRYNLEVCEKIEKALGIALTEECRENMYVARVDDCAFAMVFGCTDSLRAELKVVDIVSKLNKRKHNVIFESVSPVRAGIFVTDLEKVDFSAAIINAKTAYEFAYDENANSYIYYDGLIAKKKSKNNLKKKFSEAIDNKEFELFLQFVYSVDEKKFIGAEALSRWNSPEDGFIMPSYYINDMHTSGVIKKFDFYMFEKTCKLLEEWSNKPNFDNLMISCNITRATVSSDIFLENIKKITNKYKFNHNLLVIEITEDSLFDSQNMAYENIVGCRDLGFQIALDDFGSGHTSFADINNYPVDHIKVDRQFISKATTERGKSVLEGIIQIAESLNIKVTCEGVETKAQNEAVKKAGCHYIQGYYYSYVFSIDEACRHFLKSFETGKNKNI